MYKNKNLNRFTLLLILLSSCLFSQTALVTKEYNSVKTGAEQFDKYLPLLKGKRVALVTNVTGLVGKTSIVDTLLKRGVKIVKIFGPEHGFRSDTEAGEHVKSNKDAKTGIPVISLYGANKKPSKEQLKNVDVLVYDIQDLGVRFYTYISTMCYAMEACAENCKQFIVLDRPNPNGFYIDGPVLQQKYKSFLGLHPVPIVYGMTCGEYAQMANAEGWLKGSVKCSLTVVPLENYDRKASYLLPTKPSPNIPNEKAVVLYPGLGLFEGTMMSLGRGTEFPFQVVGHPEYKDTSFSFTPLASRITSKPRYLNTICYGIDLRESVYLTQHPRKINIATLIAVYQSMKSDQFFEINFNYHTGNALLQEQLKNNLAEEEIRSSWQEEIQSFKKVRRKYLLYEDFE